MQEETNLSFASCDPSVNALLELIKRTHSEDRPDPYTFLNEKSDGTPRFWEGDAVTEFLGFDYNNDYSLAIANSGDPSPVWNEEIAIKYLELTTERKQALLAGAEPTAEEYEKFREEYNRSNELFHGTYIYRHGPFEEYGEGRCLYFAERFVALYQCFEVEGVDGPFQNTAEIKEYLKRRISKDFMYWVDDEIFIWHDFPQWLDARGGEGWPVI